VHAGGSPEGDAVSSDAPASPGPLRVLTHCNAGALATCGIGTALAPVYVIHAAGRPVAVWADETRPLLQGSRLTAWELTAAGVPVTVVADGMAAPLLRTGRIDAVLVGADRIAANGDTANKIGTYALALAARAHGVPFYVLAPRSTVDPTTPDGAAIPIEERDPDEVRAGFGRATAPPGVAVWNPAFDVTPAELITAIVTEDGVHRPPFGFRA
jgi:methylthioribose-1-phosphate isomerase